MTSDHATQAKYSEIIERMRSGATITDQFRYYGVMKRNGDTYSVRSKVLQVYTVDAAIARYEKMFSAKPKSVMDVELFWEGKAAFAERDAGSLIFRLLMEEETCGIIRTSRRPS